ncbi:hypothetical protein AWB81_07156 [Caballeronia arationis]|jgi:hypothetical protein|nr:hypothetical protein AWB81_07156 [Caballeronia arationis]
MARFPPPVPEGWTTWLHSSGLTTTATNGFAAPSCSSRATLSGGRSVAQCGEVGPWVPSVARYSLNRAEFVRCATS